MACMLLLLLLLLPVPENQQVLLGVRSRAKRSLEPSVWAGNMWNPMEEQYTSNT